MPVGVAHRAAPCAAYAGPSVEARNGAPSASGSTVTWTPHGAASRQVRDRVPAARRRVLPGRNPQVEPRARPAADRRRRSDHRRAVDAEDGDRRTRPQHVRDCRRRRAAGRRRARRRRCGTAPPGRATPVQVRPWRPARRSWCCPRSSRRLASMRRAPPAHRAPAPPNIPECTSPASASTVTTTLTMPRRVTVTAGRPTAALPVSQTRITSAAAGRRCFGTNVLQAAGALLLRPLDDQLQVDRHVVAERRRAGQVHRGCCPCSPRCRGRTSGRRPR